MNKPKDTTSNEHKRLFGQLAELLDMLDENLGDTVERGRIARWLRNALPPEDDRFDALRKAVNAVQRSGAGMDRARYALSETKQAHWRDVFKQGGKDADRTPSSVAEWSTRIQGLEAKFPHHSLRQCAEAVAAQWRDEHGKARAWKTIYDAVRGYRKR